MVGALTNKNTFEGGAYLAEIFYGALAYYVKLWRLMVPRLYQLDMQRYCTDFMVPRLCQFTEILQRLYGAPTVSLQRFYGAPTMSIYRDIAEIS